MTDILFCVHIGHEFVELSLMFILRSLHIFLKVKSYKYQLCSFRAKWDFLGHRQTILHMTSALPETNQVMPGTVCLIHSTLWSMCCCMIPSRSMWELLDQLLKTELHTTVRMFFFYIYTLSGIIFTEITKFLNNIYIFVLFCCCTYIDFFKHLHFKSLFCDIYGSIL